MNNQLQSNQEEDNQSEEENSIQYKLILVRELRRYLNNNKNCKYSFFIFYSGPSLYRILILRIVMLFMLRYTVYYIYGNFNMHENIKDLLLQMNLHQADTKAMVTRQDKENKNYVGLIFTKIIMN